MIKPLQDRVLIQREEADEQTPGGVFIPARSQEKSLWAKVLAVGPGKSEPGGMIPTPLGVKVGDRVLVTKYAGVEITLRGSDYLLVREEDILCTSEA